jgi:hypothetical protein
MSTEPDRRAVRPSSPVPTRVRDGVDGTQPAGMLLSFERPASAHPERSCDEEDRKTALRWVGRRYRLSTVFENCTEATSTADR